MAPKKRKTASTTTKSKKSKSEEIIDVQKTKKTASQSSNGTTIKEEKPEPKPESKKTVPLYSTTPVDSECKQKVGRAHVYVEDAVPWDVMLNQTNLQYNNNKYYIIQLLEDNTQKRYSVWTRWGRVGKTGQNSLNDCGTNLERAKEGFCKKFTDKTKNDWEDRDNFEKVPGKYDLLKMDFTPEVEEETKAKFEVLKPVKTPESKLEMRVRELIELVCNVQVMEESVIEMQYDTKKAPLGKLTAGQITAGYEALKRIEELIQNNAKRPVMIQACNDFYTRIPHNFGMKAPPLITTLIEVRDKIKLLEALGDIQIALKLMNEVGLKHEHPVDSHYRSLHCDISPLDSDHSDYKLLCDYLQKTHAKTHRQYGLEVMEIFQLSKEGEDESFNDVGNRHLLWHGSRLGNWAGILGQGLRIAPPEAPVTGYMFGKGVYFADMSSKSANYCCTTRKKNVGLLVACEVALGQCNQLVDSNYHADKLPKGKHSVMGMGQVKPDPSQYVTLSNGTVVPVGDAIETEVKNPSGYTLNYNEYIVYNTNQIKLKYLVKVKFNYK